MRTYTQKKGAAFCKAPLIKILRKEDEGVLLMLCNLVYLEPFFHSLGFCLLSEK